MDSIRQSSQANDVKRIRMNNIVPATRREMIDAHFKQHVSNNVYDIWLKMCK